MADNETPEQPAETSPAADAAVEPVPAAPAPLVPRLRDRVFSFRSVVAVGVATLLLGGAGGAALVAVTGDDDGEVRISRFGDRPGRDGELRRFQYGPDGGRGFAPPGAPGGGMQQDLQPDSGSNG